MKKKKLYFMKILFFFNSKQLIVDINISHILQQIFDSDFLSKHGTWYIYSRLRSLERIRRRRMLILLYLELKWVNFIISCNLSFERIYTEGLTCFLTFWSSLQVKKEVMFVFRYSDHSLSFDKKSDKLLFLEYTKIPFLEI